jgi:DNA polymerase III delta subunit
VEFEAGRLNERLELARQIPMLGGHAFFFFSDFEDFRRATDEDYEALEAYLAQPSPFATLVFAAAEPDRRRRFLQLLEKKAVVVNLRPLARGEAADWLIRYLRDRGVEIERRLADELAAKFESQPEPRGDVRAAAVNLLWMRTEVEKLLTARCGAKRLQPEDLELIVSVREEHEMGGLLAALAERTCGPAIERLRALAAGKEPETLILWCIGDLFRQALKNGASAGAGAAGWYRSARLFSPFEAARRAARTYSRDELLLAMRAVRATDLAIKSSWKDARILLESLVWQIVLGRRGGEVPAFEAPEM